MPEAKMTKEDRKAQKHGIDTLKWMSTMIRKFNRILTDVATGKPVDEMEDELKIFYKLQKQYDKLTEPD